jgi:hypothetical protein
MNYFYIDNFNLVAPEFYLEITLFKNTKTCI